MSGGSYNYLYTRVRSLGEQRDELEAMAARLEQQPFSGHAAVQTRRVLRLLDEADAIADTLTDVWHAVEWWDSGDSGVERVIAACEAYRPPSDPQPGPDPLALYRLIDVGGGRYEFRAVGEQRA